MSPISEREVIRGHRSYLLPSNSIMPTKIRKAEAVEFLGVWIDFFIRVDSNEWGCDDCTRRNGNTIGKRERM